jgi:hypothetical protein
MAMLEIRTESTLHAYNRVSQELREVEVIALGPDATKRDIDKYNDLHGQVRRRHPDGTIGHLHRNREIVVFDGRITLLAPPKKIPFRLKLNFRSRVV